MINAKSKMLVLVSMVTDEMIRLVSMYSDVWFMDTTAGRIACTYFLYYNTHLSSHIILLVFLKGTNRQKKELFVMAVRTPSGRTFLGNFTIIPSAQKWVFHSIFHLAFMSLYGEEVCSIDR